MKSEIFQKQNKKKTLFAVGLIVLIIMGGFFAYRSHKNSAPNSAPSRQQTTVDVVSVTRSDLTKRISLTGQTVPQAQVDIAAKYQGRVVAVYADLGQQVSSGDVLVVQDTGDAEIAIAQNQAAYQQASADAVTSESNFMANYDKARADYQRAISDYNRSKSLYEVGAISRETFDASNQALADAKAGLDALANQMNSNAVASAIQSAQAAAAKAQHSVSAAQKQRDDLVLRAPRSGSIGYRQVEVGSFVSPGQKLLSIVDNSKIYVDCQVSEQDLGALKVGMNVSVQIDSMGKTFPGQIIYISPGVDSASQSFIIRIALDNPDGSIKSGMFARSIISSVLRPNALNVPKSAVLDKNGKNYVYVVNAQNAVEERIVQVGARSDQDIEILSGLNEGEQIAITNLSRLRNGLVVNPNIVTADRGDNQ